jgi:recombination protein RecT
MNDTQAVAKPSPKKTIQGILEGQAFKEAVARALPKHLKPERFIRVALTAMTRTPKLMQCTQESLFNCLLSLSAFGLEPDGRRAHLIPFENRKQNTVECTLIVDYKGLAELAMRSGVVSNLHADVVCENDVFEYDLGQIKKHVVDFRKDRGEMYAAYAICRFKDGTEKCEVLSVNEVESVRGRSRAGQSGPWVSDFREMAKKTAFRRLSKWLPLSAEFRDATEADDDAPAIDITPRSLVATVPQFEISGGEPEPAPETPTPRTSPPEDAKAEAAAGLAPEPGVAKSPQDELAALVIIKGFTFDHFNKWGVESGNIQDGLTCFDDVPKAVAVRLLKAQTGLLNGLKMAKGEA